MTNLKKTIYIVFNNDLMYEAFDNFNDAERLRSIEALESKKRDPVHSVADYWHIHSVVLNKSIED